NTSKEADIRKASIMDEKESNKLVRGALLLTLAGLVSKVLSAGYRIPLQNLTGDIGFYIYQQVYPLLGMALVFSLYGFPSAVARITVELKHQRKSLSVTHFAIPVFVLLFIMNGTIFIILYTNAQTLASLEIGRSSCRVRTNILEVDVNL